MPPLHRTIGGDRRHFRARHCPAYPRPPRSALNTAPMQTRSRTTRGHAPVRKLSAFSPLRSSENQTVLSTKRQSSTITGFFNRIHIGSTSSQARRLIRYSSFFPKRRIVFLMRSTIVFELGHQPGLVGACLLQLFFKLAHFVMALVFNGHGPGSASTGERLTGTTGGATLGGDLVGRRRGSSNPSSAGQPKGCRYEYRLTILSPFLAKLVTRSRRSRGHVFFRPRTAYRGRMRSRSWQRGPVEPARSSKLLAQSCLSSTYDQRAKPARLGSTPNLGRQRRGELVDCPRRASEHRRNIFGRFGVRSFGKNAKQLGQALGCGPGQPCFEQRATELLQADRDIGHLSIERPLLGRFGAVVGCGSPISACPPSHPASPQLEVHHRRSFPTGTDSADNIQYSTFRI
jgi:hypothetical protein